MNIHKVYSSLVELTVQILECMWRAVRRISLFRGSETPSL